MSTLGQISLGAYINGHFFFQVVAQDINTDVAVSMESIETHIDAVE